MAKVIRLSVVKNPASPLDIPRSSRIKGINGPTDAMEVRRLTEIKITPRISKALEEYLGKGTRYYDIPAFRRQVRYEIRKLKLKSNTYHGMKNLEVRKTS